MREGICLGHIFVICAVGRLALLGEDYRDIVQVRQHCRYRNPARLDGQDPGHKLPPETALEFIGNLPHYVNVNLVVKEVVHLQDIARLDDAVRKNFFFKKVHCTMFQRSSIVSNSENLSI